MYTHTLKKQPKNTVHITVHIPVSTIKAEYEKAFDVLHKDLTVEGFRKGKAPKAIAEKHMSKEAVYRQLVNTLLSRVYQEIVKKEELKPIVQPKIELNKAKENEDWEVSITVAEKPPVKLADYKKLMTDAKGEMKKDDIWVPGKGEKPAENKEENKQKVLNTILSGLLDHSTCDISDLIIENETDDRLARLVDDVQKVGLSMETYLKSKNLTLELLKEQYKKEIEATYKMEFILNELADVENIQVEQSDIEKLFAAVKDPKEREQAMANAYMYAAVLRKQKTLDFLTGL